MWRVENGLLVGLFWCWKKSGLFIFMVLDNHVHSQIRETPYELTLITGWLCLSELWEKSKSPFYNHTHVFFYRTGNERIDT